jgi:hypothetical protein
MIVVVGFLFVCSYSMKALMASTLIIPAASEENRTSLNMLRTIAMYL